MRIREVQLLGRKGDNTGSVGGNFGNESAPARQDVPASVDEATDDLPF
jgi:hypothetical protein